jgi:acetolactate synthase small subunit
VPAVDAALARMRMVLERMLELESVNEVIERLRGVIRVQEEIRRETLERQRKRGREALESP